jgi:pimeloyl-[acyl-carrier protein] synthase
MKRSPHDLTPDFSSEAFQRNPYQHYSKYLSETPVFRSDEGVVYLTRYNDCVELLSHDSFRRSPPAGGCNPFSDAQRAQTPFEIMISNWMWFMDPPRHDVVRKAFMPPFTSKAVHEYEPLIHRIVGQLLEELPQEGTVEFLQSFAFPLAVMVIADILGVPQRDRDQFGRWSLLLMQALDAGREEDILKGEAVSLTLRNYFGDLLRQRHALPRNSLLNVVANDGSLTEDERLYGCVFVLWAGHETTRNLIANGILLLAERPLELARLQQQPALMESAVEEMLRFESPVQKLSRWAHADSMFGDYFVPQGTLLTALIGAANRDPVVFSRPNEFDMHRTPNRHIAFGTGIHHCPGATLARCEGRIALGALVSRLRCLEPVQHRWGTYSAVRSLESLSAKVQQAC